MEHIEADYKRKYEELVDALCSKSWIGRERHESVLSVAKRMKAKESQIVPMYKGADVCTRAAGHKSPCNGWPREDCPQ